LIFNYSIYKSTPINVHNSSTTKEVARLKIPSNFVLLSNDIPNSHIGLNIFIFFTVISRMGGLEHD